MKFRKKPVVVDAIQWGGFNRQIAIPEITEYDAYKENPLPCDKCGSPISEHGNIPTLEGYYIVCPNDWIITGVKGDKYPCKPDIFKLTYELAE